jgi:hypothetical protein
VSNVQTVVLFLKKIQETYQLYFFLKNIQSESSSFSLVRREIPPGESDKEWVLTVLAQLGRPVEKGLPPSFTVTSGELTQQVFVVDVDTEHIDIPRRFSFLGDYSIWTDATSVRCDNHSFSLADRIVIGEYERLFKETHH